MKKLRLLLFLFVFLTVGANMKAQVFGHPGATWMFHSPPMWGMCPETYESWTYENDTIVLGILAKDISVTRKIQYMFWPFDFQTQTFHRLFNVSGDTVSVFIPADSTWQIIFDFSLDIGDITHSPVRNIYGILQGCGDTVVGNLPAVVIDTGISVIGGQALRSYTVYYIDNIDINNDTTYNTVSYYERIITQGYWYPPTLYFCGGISECGPIPLLCYKDNDMLTDSSCADLSWFETLSIDDPFNASSVQIYPNPAQDLLFISGLEDEVIQYQIFSADGKLVGNFSGNGSVQISPLPSGLYFITNENRTWFKKFIKH